MIVYNFQNIIKNIFFRPEFHTVVYNYFTKPIRFLNVFRENVIKSTSQMLCKCVLTTRALNEDKAKKAAQETQQNSQQQNQEQ